MVDGWIDRWLDGCMMDGCVDRFTVIIFPFSVHACLWKDTFGRRMAVDYRQPWSS